MHWQLPRCNRVARTARNERAIFPSMIKPDLRPILRKTSQSDHTSNAFAIWFIHRFSRHANLRLWNERRIHLSLMDQIDPRTVGISSGYMRMIDRVSEIVHYISIISSEQIRLHFWRKLWWKRNTSTDTMTLKCRTFKFQIRRIIKHALYWCCKTCIILTYNNIIIVAYT